MPPPNRFLAGSGTLAAVGLLLLAYAVCPDFLARRQVVTAQGAGSRTRTVAFALGTQAAPGRPGVDKKTLESHLDGGSGGHPLGRGTGTQLGSTSPMPDPLDPLMNIPPLRDGAPAPEGALELPTGLKRGDGLVEARGEGGGSLGSLRPGFDHRLVPRYTPRAKYTLQEGEDGNEVIVVVEVTVEDSGRVSRAKALAGPPYLYESILKAALQWLFEPLRPHGLTGPVHARINFRCSEGQ